jgi:hypothetical protein
LYLDDILTLAAVVLSIIFFFFYRRYQFTIYNEIDRRYYTQDDFTIFIENLPVFIPVKHHQWSGEKVFYYEEAVKEVLEDKLRDWIDRLKATKGEGENDDKLDKAMYEVIQNEKDFDEIPKVRSISLCQDLTEIEKLIDTRNRLLEYHAECV